MEDDVFRREALLLLLGSRDYGLIVGAKLMTDNLLIL